MIGYLALSAEGAQRHAALALRWQMHAVDRVGPRRDFSAFAGNPAPPACMGLFPAGDPSSGPATVAGTIFATETRLFLQSVFILEF